jgi:hypothetical protein
MTPRTKAVTGFAERLVDEAEAIVTQADKDGYRVRVIGGAGIQLLLGSRLESGLARELRDIDLIIRRRHAPALEKLLVSRGWSPAREFNALNGARRLLFHDPRSDAQIDVFIGAFEMAHKLPLIDYLDQPGPALPATALLMTKLQIVELNSKDLADLYALLAGSELDSGHHASISISQIAELTSSDWGLHHTFELNIERLAQRLPESALSPTGAQKVRQSLSVIAGAMDKVPKTRTWKLRARIGERKRWYEEPEEVDRG